MLNLDTKIILSNKNHKEIKDVTINDIVKTKLGNKHILEVVNGKESGYKIIFSDGYKAIFGNSQELLMYTKEWKKVKELKEGDLILKPDDTHTKIVDITPVNSINGYNLILEESCGFTLSNGIYTK